MSASSTAVCTARWALSASPAPMAVATTTLAPNEIPWNSDTSSEMMNALLPTPASALVPTSWPATAMSAVLYSCCKMAVTATGMLKSRILSHMLP